MWGSLKGARDYLGGAVLASVVVGSGCGLPVALEGGDSGKSGGNEAAATLLAAAEAGALWGLTNAPAQALAAAKVWEATGGDCPGRTEENETVVLTGGCTTADGVALAGAVRVNRVPDGGSWVFEAWEERRGGEVNAWTGNLSWVQTDGANNVTAYDFGAGWPSAGGLFVGAEYTFAGLLLDDLGRAIGATGAAVVTVAEDAASLELGGAWAYDGCDANPTSGATTWTAVAAGADAEAESEGEPSTSVIASFDGLACGACVPWRSSGGEMGEWCGG